MPKKVAHVNAFVEAVTKVPLRPVRARLTEMMVIFWSAMITKGTFLYAHGLSARSRKAIAF
jgi:hypothetical protein